MKKREEDRSDILFNCASREVEGLQYPGLTFLDCVAANGKVPAEDRERYTDQRIARGFHNLRVNDYDYFWRRASLHHRPTGCTIYISNNASGKGEIVGERAREAYEKLNDLAKEYGFNLVEVEGETR